MQLFHPMSKIMEVFTQSKLQLMTKMEKQLELLEKMIYKLTDEDEEGSDNGEEENEPPEFYEPFSPTLLWRLTSLKNLLI